MSKEVFVKNNLCSLFKLCAVVSGIFIECLNVSIYSFGFFLLSFYVCVKRGIHTNLIYFTMSQLYNKRISQR